MTPEQIHDIEKLCDIANSLGALLTEIFGEESHFIIYLHKPAYSTLVGNVDQATAIPVLEQMLARCRNINPADFKPQKLDS